MSSSETVVIIIRITKAIKVKIAAISPSFPISLAIASSFYWRGVASASWVTKAYILPTQEFGPTTVTTYLPSPVSTLVPDSIAGDGTEWLSEVFLAFS